MANFPVEIWLMAFRYFSLPDLAKVRLTCKAALRWAVVGEVKSRMQVGLLRGQGALLMEESMERRMKALKNHPLNLTSASHYTKSVFKQTSAEDAEEGYLVFEDAAENSAAGLLLCRSSDLSFAELVFPDHIRNTASDGEGQYSFLCIYGSHDFVEPKETIFDPNSDLIHLKLLSTRAIRTDIAINALKTFNGEFLRSLRDMTLPTLAGMNLDMHIWGWCSIPTGQLAHWWYLTRVRLVLRGDENTEPNYSSRVLNSHLAE
jgi:hypothetical protein